MKKVMWINPRSKGNLGSTLAMEAGVSWLARHGINWRGANLDDRHPAFANRYPRQVQTSAVGDGIEGKGELLRVFSRAIQAEEPVYVVDSRAQADRLIIDAMSASKLFDSARRAEMKVVFWITPYDEDEHTRNLADLIQFADAQVEWLVVQNPTKAPCRTYPGGGIQRALHKLDANEITLPGITAPTMLTLERHCLAIKRELSLAEAAQDERLPMLNQAEIQYFLGEVFRQLDLVAGHILPSAEAARVEPVGVAAARTRKTPDLMAGYGDHCEL